MRSCETCENPLSGGPRQRFCSDRCRYRARDQRPEVRCRQRDQKRAAYQSARDAGEVPAVLARQRAANGWAPRVVRDAVCTVDGCARSHLARGFCGRHYKLDALRRGVPWATLATQPGSDRARARHYGVEYEPINRAQIYERDGWRCGICGDSVSPSLRFPHAMSVSLDHIVPVVRGGGHLAGNVQCAHLVCNLRKSDKAVA